MYDRGVDLEYRKESASTNSPASASQEKSIAEKYVEEAFTQIKMGKDGDSVYHPLYKAWRAMQADPACIKKIITRERQAMAYWYSYRMGQ